LLTGESDREFLDLLYDLVGLSNLMLRIRKHLADYIGVRDAQRLIMMVIAEAHGATVGQIAKRLNVSSPFVTSEAGDLVRRGLIEKRPNASDRRSVILHLTAKGDGLLREVAPLRCKINDMMFRSVARDQAKAFKDIIKTLVADGESALHEAEAPHLIGRKAPSAQPEAPARTGSPRLDAGDRRLTQKQGSGPTPASGAV
jgi:DNA-binding MarR family transcriptional regulator